MPQPSEIIKFGTLENYLFKADKRIDSYNDKTFLEYLEKEISNMFPNESPELVSTDVFDTLLLRKPESELRHFFEIAGKIAEMLKSKGVDTSAEEVLVARYIATEINYKVSKKIKGHREGSIDEIHSSMLKLLNCSEELKTDSVEVELEHEMDSLIPNRNLWEVIKKMSDKGVKIVLVSDMYLHEPYIAKLVKNFFIDYEEVVSKLYSSADYKLSKASGKLFDEVCDDLDVEPTKCLHMGDGFANDYKQAIFNGWKSIYLPKSKLFNEQVEKDKQILIEKLNNQSINFNQWIRK